jgi:hypothetical protein
MMNWKEDELWEAVTQRDLNAVRACIKKGAQVDFVSQERGAAGKTLLHHAASIGDAQVFELLDSVGGRRNWTAYKGNLPLHLAAMCNRLEIVKWCIENGADPNMLGENGYTCLHFAAKHGYGDMVAYLLDHGARTDVRGRDQKTPSMLSKDEEILHLFAFFEQNFAAKTASVNSPIATTNASQTQGVAYGRGPTGSDDIRGYGDLNESRGRGNSVGSSRVMGNPGEIPRDDGRSLGGGRRRQAPGTGAGGGGVAGIFGGNAEAQDSIGSRGSRRQGKGGLGVSLLCLCPLHFGMHALVVCRGFVSTS